MSRTVGERLRGTLNDCGMSMRELHRVAHVPYRSIQNYVMDKQKPGADALLKIRTALGVNIDWLLTGEGEQFVSSSVIKPRKANFGDIIDVIDKFSNIEDVANLILKLKQAGDSYSSIYKTGEKALRNIERLRPIIADLIALEEDGKLPAVDFNKLTIPEIYDLHYSIFGRQPDEDATSTPGNSQ